MFDILFPREAGGVYSLGHASPGRTTDEVVFPVYANGKHVGYARVNSDQDGTQRLQGLHRPIDSRELHDGPAVGGDFDVNSAPEPLDTSPPETKVLDFTTFPQQNSNWSWAAVSASVALFLKPNTQLTPCSIVGSVLGNNGCCATPTPSSCNVWMPPEDGLTDAGVLNATIAGAPSYAIVQAQINSNVPVVAWFKPTSGGNAAFTFYGYTTPSVVYVADPNLGYFATGFADIPTNYMGGGSYQSYDTTEAS